MNSIEDRAAEFAREIITYFECLDKLGAREEVKDQKQGFLSIALINFAKRETWPLESKLNRPSH